MKLSTTYKILDGDTFETIALKTYGIRNEGNTIARANPGVNEPLTPGTIITIPDLPGKPKNLQQNINAVDEDETAILIDGRRFRFWDNIRFTRALDTIDIVEFGAPLDTNISNFKETFKPFSYKNVVITVGDNPIFTGTMVSVVPVVEENKKIVSISCYSKPGVLNDCTPPASLYAQGEGQLEFNGQGLTEIIKTLVTPFGISVDFQADQGAIFDRVAIQAGEKIFSFLAKLVKQRNLILTNDIDGQLVVWQSTPPGTPVAVLSQGEPPILSITPFFSPQEYYSHITGIEPVLVGLEGSQFTVRNTRLLGVTRPLTFNAPDTIGSNLKSAVEAKAGRMFGNLVSYSVRVATWRDSSGALWEPNKTIKIIAPDAMIYSDYEFIIRSVEFDRDDTTKTATLNLVLPGSFSGEIPDTLPWD